MTLSIRITATNGSVLIAAIKSIHSLLSGYKLPTKGVIKGKYFEIEIIHCG